MNEKLLKNRIIDYNQKNLCPAEYFATTRCDRCQGTVFQVLMNEWEGVAARICTSCNTERAIGDSDDFFDEVEEVYPIKCECGGDRFEIMAGVALYRYSQYVKWFYLGCECVECKLSGVYGDWKNEFSDYKVLLSRL